MSDLTRGKGSHGVFRKIKKKKILVKIENWISKIKPSAKKGAISEIKVPAPVISSSCSGSSN